MAEPSRRVNARFGCVVPLTIFTGHGGEKMGEGQFIDISVGGALLWCRCPLEMGHTYHFHCAEGLRLDGKVVRQHKKKGAPSADLFYGLILDPSKKQETKIRQLIDRLRMPSKDTPFEERLKNYWG